MELAERRRAAAFLTESLAGAILSCDTLGMKAKQYRTKMEKVEGFLKTIERSFDRRLETERRAVRCCRNLAETALRDLIAEIHPFDQSDVWKLLDSKGCRYLGPRIQGSVLKAIIKAYQGKTFMTKHDLINCVEQELRKPSGEDECDEYEREDRPSRTQIGRVIQILYRAGSFELLKNDAIAIGNDRDDTMSSDALPPSACNEKRTRMRLKETLMEFNALVKLHDSTIIKWAYEEKVYLTPDQWNTVLYRGNKQYKSQLQSIIDLIKPASLTQSIDALNNWMPATHIDIQPIERALPALRKLAEIPSDKEFQPDFGHLQVAVESLKLVIEALSNVKQLRGSSMATSRPVASFRPKTRSDPASPVHSPPLRAISSAGSRRSWQPEPTHNNLPCNDSSFDASFSSSVSCRSDNSRDGSIGSSAFDGKMKLAGSPVGGNFNRSRLNDSGFGGKPLATRCDRRVKNSFDALVARNEMAHLRVGAQHPEPDRTEAPEDSVNAALHQLLSRNQLPGQTLEHDHVTANARNGSSYWPQQDQSAMTSPFQSSSWTDCRSSMPQVEGRKATEDVQFRRLSVGVPFPANAGVGQGLGSGYGIGNDDDLTGLLSADFYASPKVQPSNLNSSFNVKSDLLHDDDGLRGVFETLKLSDSFGNPAANNYGPFAPCSYLWR